VKHGRNREAFFLQEKEDPLHFKKNLYQKMPTQSRGMKIVKAKEDLPCIL